MKYPIQVLFREYFEGILAAIFLALFLRFFVLNILYIPSENMKPNLERGDFVLGWRLSYGFPLPLMRGERLNFKAPVRGDLIAFRFPGDEEQIIIRRVIGVPGDTVVINSGVVAVNGQLLEQSSGESGIAFERPFQGEGGYTIKASSHSSMKEVKVPKGKIFVLSDNRLPTDDSRDWGFVPFKNVESRIALVWLSIQNNEDGLSFNWPRIFTWIQ